MKRVEGSSQVELIECIHPAKNRWSIRWDIHTEQNGSATYMEEEFNHRPTEQEITDTVLSWTNEQTNKKIINGFTWNGYSVWLSTENQFNYKAAFDLAVQTEGRTLPVTFKFGTDKQPEYHTFNTLTQLEDFYTKAMKHIQDTLADGWSAKDRFSIDSYRI